MNWLRVAFRGRVCDGIDKLLTFEVSKDGEFHGAVVGLLPLCGWSKWLILWLSGTLHLSVSVRVATWYAQ